MTSDMPETLGERIVQARKLKGISQKELASKLEVTPTALNYYEKNKRKPNYCIIVQLADCLDVSIEFLLGKEPIAKSEPYKLHAQGKYREFENMVGLPSGSIIIPSGTRILEDETIVPNVPEWVDVKSLPKTTLRAIIHNSLGRATIEEKKEILAVLKYVSKELGQYPEYTIFEIDKLIHNMSEERTTQLVKILNSLNRATPEEVDKIFRLIELMLPDEEKKE